MMTREKLDELDSQNKIYFTKNGKPRRKNFLEDYAGAEVDNQWLDVLPIGQVQSEIIGYPTQKPEALLERIIQCASKEGDIVLDPFVGGGTTIAVADRLNRLWIGIDQSPMAVKVSEFRLQKQTELFTAPYTVQLYKYDYDTLRYVEDIVPIAVKPALGVHIRELARDMEKGVRQIEFIAAGDSPAGIEFYSWDFSYNPEKKFKAAVIMDKEGRQVVSFKPGTHYIVCKVVDNEGLENTEVIKLKINGAVEREE